MIVGLTNTPRDYAWGSTSAIAELLGRRPSGAPEAEYWLGAHPGSPSEITDSAPALAGRHLDEVLAAEPEAFVGPGRTRLPFLMKVLAADHALSLQVHPDPEQARAGFARENEAGVALDAPERNYRDDSAKPELILALSPAFEALAGFRHVSEARLLLAELQSFAADGDDADAIGALADRLAAGDPGQAGSTGSSMDVNATGMPDSGVTAPDHAASGNPLRDAVEWLLRGGSDVARLVPAIVGAAARASATSSFRREFDTVAKLADEHPGDPGIVLALLLNRITLAQGQAMFLPAGSIHAYLEGVGIEVMTQSDNVLRGGLTSKHIDVDELLAVTRFQAEPVPLSHPDSPVEGVRVWRVDSDDFVLAEVALGDAAEVHGYRLAGPERTSFRLTGPAIVLTLTGGITLQGATMQANLARGDAAFVTPDEGDLVFSGSGVAYVTTTP
ncbi:mannose-6-phosphate isomerase, class I [Amnibacterium sp. CER49]|uniref:mannose-6-phosphate isomerase, class I n=1 Tax=Amnibacterium sp. CER49 TaxID=3039161 RepID=UPI002449C2DC|nr:mannose-6-phosphate isomerase, class I [Amnibacterium sp. CER49]MDH2443063.1 mannose-6-phosphate isomerase, class I [Amnibacterium sp. CER49]